MEDICKMIDEFFYRTGGEIPAELICGRRLFQQLDTQDRPVPFQTKYVGVPINDDDEEISISEEEFLQILNGYE